MKGLLTKDFRILAGQKRYFTIIILIALIFLCSGQPAQIIVGYCTMFGMLFTVNTISYDEFDHGYLFLFTLPVTRKDYVLEKYVFMLLCGGGFWAVSAAAGFVADYIRGDVVSLLEWLMPMFLILLEMTIFLAVMLPVSLKYGMEKKQDSNHDSGVCGAWGRNCSKEASAGEFCGRAEVVCAVKSCGRDCGSVSDFPGHIGGILCGQYPHYAKKGILRIATLQIVQKIG